MFTRVVSGRARVVREVRAAAPLMARLRAPVPARGPWLTAVLTTASSWSKPVAVVVEPHRQGRPAALALLGLRSRGPVVQATLLGDGPATPAPEGRPPFRLLAADPAAADLLAAGVVDLLGSLRRPWTLRLAGLPLGCPTTAALAARIPSATFGSGRTERLVDALDRLGPVHRTTDARVLERALPALLAGERDRRARTFVRTTSRVHAAIGQLELAVVGGPERPRAALLTLLDGADRWPWRGVAAPDALPREMGAPLVSLSAIGGPRPQLPWTAWPPRLPRALAELLPTRRG
ncbi:hypothetical protein ACI8AF_08150 [Blastococcus sp. SYSU D00669]